MPSQPLVTLGQVPIPKSVTVTVEPGAVPTPIYTESPVSVLQLLELVDAITLTVPSCPPCCGGTTGAR